MKGKTYHIYILTNAHHNVLYTGVTGDLIQRIWLHRQGKIAGFTKKYNVHTLIYIEAYDQVQEAIAREKQLKGWRRSKKENLINRLNPAWRDLFDEII